MPAMTFERRRVHSMEAALERLEAPRFIAMIESSRCSATESTVEKRAASSLRRGCRDGVKHPRVCLALHIVRDRVDGRRARRFALP